MAPSSTYLTATLLIIGALVQSTTAYNSSIFQTIQPVFDFLLGSTPTVEALVKSPANQQLYHEGGAYHPPTGALWVVSDQIANATNRPIFRVTDLDSPASVHVERINHTIPIPVGAYRNVPGSPLGDVILFAAQGTLAKSPPAGVYAMNPYPPYNTSLVIGAYGDNAFNSLDDVTVSPDGVIFFSDPPYGFGQGNRPHPMLPNQVYSFNPRTNDLRVAADGFVRPNGVKASPDGNTIYIGDTGANLYEHEPLDLQGSRTIYAFDRVDGFLTNRRVFAMPQAYASAADGIKVDSYGNVWAAVAGQGISVWDKRGLLLGGINISVAGGNLGFGRPGEVYLLGGDTIFKVSVSKAVVGA
ncbi:hypothetical protein B0A55_07432 [Friedmanniomyces simplex]|uniref:SMP-30/Gluconolactonase/LRE-like region domain-containing protein n=1 Tax=Friedmanniomyces simplex TaxID=329884 RepID=A0A4U0X536_9PEZI|nr:hypothetical protein B0A55_07432 [Friedmanniomyces simplex]